MINKVKTQLEPDDVAIGRIALVDLHGIPVAIANVDGRFFAISDTCPHAGCSLSQGLLEETAVTCRIDGSRFDLASGNVLKGPATVRVRTYRVQVRGGKLSI